MNSWIGQEQLIRGGEVARVRAEEPDVSISRCLIGQDPLRDVRRRVHHPAVDIPGDVLDRIAVARRDGEQRHLCRRIHSLEFEIRFAETGDDTSARIRRRVERNGGGEMMITR